MNAFPLGKRFADKFGERISIAGPAVVIVAWVIVKPIMRRVVCEMKMDCGY